MHDTFSPKHRWLLAAALVLLSALPLFAAERVLFEGTWTKKGFDIAGNWSVVEDGGRHFVVLDETFRTKNAPDLKIFLSPKPLGELDNRNATEGAVLVGQLTSSSGAQRLAVPAGTDPSRFATLVLHCEQYSKLWGGAALR
jgi:hypothetical protein